MPLHVPILFQSNWNRWFQGITQQNEPCIVSVCVERYLARDRHICLVRTVKYSYHIKR